jgi:hypothetical protein
MAPPSGACRTQIHTAGPANGLPAGTGIVAGAGALSAQAGVSVMVVVPGSVAVSVTGTDSVKTVVVGYV